MSIIVPGHAALRKGRCSQAGVIHLLTTTVHDRAPLFADRKLARAACRAFTQPHLIRDARLLAWVLMPDHPHWLVQSSERVQLPTIACRLKSASARAVNRYRGQTGRLWSAAYHDRALRDDDDLLAAARYIVANPLRAGLVRRVGDYPYWDAVWL